MSGDGAGKEVVVFPANAFGETIEKLEEDAHESIRKAFHGKSHPRTIYLDIRRIPLSDVAFGFWTKFVSSLELLEPYELVIQSLSQDAFPEIQYPVCEIYLKLKNDD